MPTQGYVPVTAEQMNSYQKAYDSAPGAYQTFEGDKYHKVTSGDPGGVQITQSKVTPEYQQYLKDKADYYYQQRLQAGWTGNNALTAPDGSTGGPTGYLYGKYTNPYATRTPGMVNLDASGGGPRMQSAPGTGGVPGQAAAPPPPPQQPPVQTQPPAPPPQQPQQPQQPQYPGSGTGWGGYGPYGPPPGLTWPSQNYGGMGGMGMPPGYQNGQGGGGMMGSMFNPTRQPSYPMQGMFNSLMGFWG